MVAQVCGQNLINRIIGQSGEWVEIVEGRLIVEHYASKPLFWSVGKGKVPEGRYLLVGDKRQSMLTSFYIVSESGILTVSGELQFHYAINRRVSRLESRPFSLLGNRSHANQWAAKSKSL